MVKAIKKVEKIAEHGEETTYSSRSYDNEVIRKDAYSSEIWYALLKPMSLMCKR
ncbi:hypothetical protein ACLB1R_26690 [Escherichia coli]